MGSISYGQRTQLHFNYGNLNAQRYRDKILRPIVVLFIRSHQLMFQHDNARPVVEKNTQLSYLSKSKDTYIENDSRKRDPVKYYLSKSLKVFGFKCIRSKCIAKIYKVKV